MGCSLRENGRVANQHAYSMHAYIHACIHTRFNRTCSLTRDCFFWESVWHCAYADVQAHYFKTYSLTRHRALRPQDKHSRNDTPRAATGLHRPMLTTTRSKARSKSNERRKTRGRLGPGRDLRHDRSLGHEIEESGKGVILAVELVRCHFS